MLNTQKRDNKGYLKIYYKNLSSSIIVTIYRLDRGIVPGHFFHPRMTFSNMSTLQYTSEYKYFMVMNIGK